jgi:DNA polymerase-3 subunit epsilon
MILVVFDLETTGLDRNKDHIIQFSGIKIDTSNHSILDSKNIYIQPFGEYSISIGAYTKHHITPEFLKDKPYFKDVAQEIVDFIGDNNVVTYNGNGFDIPFLKTELNKYGYDIDFMNRKCFDAFLEEKRRNGINLENTYLRYRGKTMEEAGLVAHDAMSDIKATYAVFVAQQQHEAYDAQKMYGEDSAIIDANFNGEIKPCFCFGKYRNVSVEYVAKYDQNYLKWCVSDKCNFMDSTKKYIQTYIN